MAPPITRRATTPLRGKNNPAAKYLRAIFYVRRHRLKAEIAAYSYKTITCSVFLYFYLN